MAITSRGLKNIRTLSRRVDQRAQSHRTYMQITCLEMEKSRRGAERRTTSVRLAEIVGRPKAKELSILGDPISAEEAYRLGLVLRVVPHEKLMAEAMEFAERIASKPRLAVQMAKSFYNRGLGGDEMRHAIDGFPLLFMHDDAREGISAFREKRKPKFGS